MIEAPTLQGSKILNFISKSMNRNRKNTNKE